MIYSPRLSSRTDRSTLDNRRVVQRRDYERQYLVVNTLQHIGDTVALQTPNSRRISTHSQRHYGVLRPSTQTPPCSYCSRSNCDISTVPSVSDQTNRGFNHGDSSFTDVFSSTSSGCFYPVVTQGSYISSVSTRGRTTPSAHGSSSNVQPIFGSSVASRNSSVPLVYRNNIYDRSPTVVRGNSSNCSVDPPDRLTTRFHSTLPMRQLSVPIIRQPTQSPNNTPRSERRNEIARIYQELQSYRQQLRTRSTSQQSYYSCTGSPTVSHDRCTIPSPHTDEQGQAPLGLPDDLIDGFPTSHYDVEIGRSWNEALKTCSVCLEEYEQNDELKRLPCTHAYHTNCIATWLRCSTVCPVSSASASSLGAVSGGKGDFWQMRRYL